MSVIGVFFTGLLGLYGTATQTSIAAMEIISWSLFALALGVWVYRSINTKRLEPLGVGPDLWLWAYVLITFLSLALSELPGARLEFASKVRWVPLLYSTAYAWTFVSKERQRYLLHVFFAVNAVAAIYATVQFFLGIELFRSRQILSPNGDYWRASGFFNLPLTFAYISGMYGFLAASRLWRAPVKVWFKGQNLIWTIGAWAGLVCCLTSLTRGAWVGIAATSVFILSLANRRRLLPSFVLGTLLLTVLLISSQGLRQRILSIGQIGERTNQHRLTIWRGHWETFKANPVLGVGLGANNLVSQDYFEKAAGLDEESAKRFYQDTGIPKADYQSHAHNNYLHQAAGTGILGLTCYLAFCWFFLRLSWRLYLSGDAWTSDVGLGVLGAQVFFHIGGLTEANFFDGEVNHALIFLWALLVGLSRETCARAKT